MVLFVFHPKYNAWALLFCTKLYWPQYLKVSWLIQFCMGPGYTGYIVFSSEYSVLGVGSIWCLKTIFVFWNLKASQLCEQLACCFLENMRNFWSLFFIVFIAFIITIVIIIMSMLMWCSPPWSYIDSIQSANSACCDLRATKWLVFLFMFCTLETLQSTKHYVYNICPWDLFLGF